MDLVLIKYIGIFAAALSTFLGFFIMWITRMKDIEAFFPIKINMKIFATYLLVSILIAVVVIWTNNKIDIVLVLLATIFFLIDNRKSICKIIKILKRRLLIKRNN